MYRKLPAVPEAGKLTRDRTRADPIASNRRYLKTDHKKNEINYDLHYRAD